MGQIKFNGPSEDVSDADVEPTISLAPPPTKGKGTISAKQDKDRKTLSVMIFSQQNSDDNSPNALLTLYPTSKSVAIEWRDALRYLTGVAPGSETEQFAKQLADIGVRVKLLDLVAGGVEIPKTQPSIEGVSTTPGTAGKVAITGEFWYDSMLD